MKKAYFCIDGFSFKRMSSFYKHEHNRHSRLNIAAMESYLRYEIKRRLECDSSAENLEIEKHFYYPNGPKKDACYTNAELSNCGYAIHQGQNSTTSAPNCNILPDWQAAKTVKNYDIFAIFTTQGQYVSLLRQTRQFEIPSILIGWDSICRNSNGERRRWQTDKALIDYASVYCPMEKVLNRPDKRIFFSDAMFEKSLPSYPLNLQCG